MIVVDSSAIVDLLLRFRQQAAWVDKRLAEDGDLHAPHLLDVEVVGSVRRVVLAGALAAADALRALDVLQGLPIVRYPHLPHVGRMWELRATLTAPDAAFVALAEALDAPLVTTDTRLARSHGHSATIVAP